MSQIMIKYREFSIKNNIQYNKYQPNFLVNKKKKIEIKHHFCPIFPVQSAP